MKHNKQAWTIAVLFLLAGCILLGGWQINNGGGGSGGGAPTVGTLDLTAQTADVSATNIVASVTTAGTYMVTCYEVVTTAAATSSTLPNCFPIWTDKDNSTLISSQSNKIVGTVTTNALTSNSLASGFPGVGLISVKAGTAIQIQTSGYASNAANTMQFSLHARVVGPL